MKELISAVLNDIGDGWITCAEELYFAITGHMANLSIAAVPLGGLQVGMECSVKEELTAAIGDRTRAFEGGSPLAQIQQWRLQGIQPNPDWTSQKKFWFWILCLQGLGLDVIENGDHP